MHLLIDSLFFFTTAIAAIHFFCGTVIISRDHLKRSIGAAIISRDHLKWSLCQGYCVYSPKLIAPINYIKWTCLLQEILKVLNFKGIVFFGGKQLQSFFFKSVRLFHRTSCSNFCLKSTMLKALAAIFCQFHNSNCSYPLWHFLEKQKSSCSQFVLVRVTFIRSSYFSLNFLFVYCSFLELIF